MPTAPTGLPAPVFAELETASDDGLRIATYLLGPVGQPSAGDVVLCHGTPWSAQVWAPVAQTLSTRYRVFLWDMPGYGASPKDAAHPVDLAAQRRRLAALLRHWSLDRPHVVAHDVGGAVALGAHLLEGVDLASLYLLDIVTLDPWGSPFFRLVAEHEEVFAALPGPLHASLVREYIAGAAHHQVATERVEALAEPWLDDVGQAAFYRQIAQLTPAHTRPIVDRLDAVRCPVRIGWATDDPWIPVEQAVRLRAALPGAAEVEEFPGRGHLVPLEDPAAVEQSVRRWLDRRAGL